VKNHSFCESPKAAELDQTALSGTPSQSQQWLIRPVFFRGIDNALLEKQEAARVATSLPWWNDAGQQQDVLQMLKYHGVNMVRLRPSSVPPYANISQPGCSGKCLLWRNWRAGSEPRRPGQRPGARRERHASRQTPALLSSHGNRAGAVAMAN
jgi:hypothetical protein